MVLNFGYAEETDVPPPVADDDGVEEEEVLQLASSCMHTISLEDAVSDSLTTQTKSREHTLFMTVGEV